MVLYFILLQTFYNSESLFNPLWVDPNWIIIFVSRDLGVEGWGMETYQEQRDQEVGNLPTMPQEKWLKNQRKKKFCLKKKKKFETTDQQSP